MALWHGGLENINPSQGYAMINSLPSASRRANRIIRLPFSQEEYNRVLNDPKEFRDAIDQMAGRYPQLFPTSFQDGYKIKDIRHSARLKIHTRRIVVGHVAYNIQPSFIMPYMTGKVDDRESSEKTQRVHISL